MADREKPGPEEPQPRPQRPKPASTPQQGKRETSDERRVKRTAAAAEAQIDLKREAAERRAKKKDAES